MGTSPSWSRAKKTDELVWNCSTSTKGKCWCELRRGLNIRVLMRALDAVENVSSFWVIAVHLGVLQCKNGFIRKDHCMGYTCQKVLWNIHAELCGGAIQNRCVFEQLRFLLTFTLYFLRAQTTLAPRCPTMTIPATPVITTRPYSLDRTTIFTDLEQWQTRAYVYIDINNIF